MPCDDHHPAMPHMDQIDLCHTETGEHVETYLCGLCGQTVNVTKADCGECWREWPYVAGNGRVS